MERDPSVSAEKSSSVYFNSHAHVERDDRRNRSGARDLNFNSHAHVERDMLQMMKKGYRKISTHTLTWSVTVYKEYKSGANGISTHTLTWSVTLDVVYIWCLLNVMRTYFFI